MSRIRLLIVDDSAVVRTVVASALSADPEIEIVGTAANGRLALEALAKTSVDVVTLDVEMPVMNGLETLREIRKRSRELPVIMFSALTAPSARVTMKALFLGANDYVQKPTRDDGDARTLIRKELLPRIKALGAKTRSRPAAAPAPKATPTPPPARRSGSTRTPKVLAIGVSTGGPDALSSIIPKLPATFPVPVLIVQHMPAMFTKFLATNLESRSNIPVTEAREGEELRPGHAYVAPGDWHLQVGRRGSNNGPLIARLDQGPPENACRPAVDVLFRSLARTVGAQTLAVVLTGMGHDGTKGCQPLREAGAQILAQDEASSVVWGMPGSVVQAGLADGIVPLGKMASEIVQHTRGAAAVALPRAETIGTAIQSGIVWSDALFATGIPQVDKEHRDLFDHVNALVSAAAEGKGSEEVLRTVQFLQRYVVEHFRAEEELMSRLKCPAAEENRAAHADFLRKFMALKLKIEREGASEKLAAELEQMVRRWLVNHILRVDLKLKAVAPKAAART
jgi:two-component system chemotaxis response regulator CheB